MNNARNNVASAEGKLALLVHQIHQGFFSPVFVYCIYVHH